MKNTKKQIIGATVLFFLLIITCYSFTDYIQKQRTNQEVEKMEKQKEVIAIKKFNESAGKTLKMYDHIKYDINQNLVFVIIDLDAWNAITETEQKDYMNEIYSLIHVDAHTSGILEYHDVSVSFMTSDYKNVHPYKKIKKGSN